MGVGTLTSVLSISETMTLDLNGFDIKQTGSGQRVISISSGGNLTLEDSNPSGKTSYGYWDTSDTYVITDDLSSIPSDTYYTTLEGGIIYGGSAGSGGGVYVSSGVFTMKAGTISDNEADYGGGVYIYSSGTFTMNDGTVERNTAQTGNRVYLYGASAIFSLKTSLMPQAVTIKGALFTDDADSYNMTVHTNNSSITIDNGTSVTTTQNADDIAYFTGETWTFEQPSIDFSTIIT